MIPACCPLLPRLLGEGSQRGQKLRELGAPWRLLLTGTPLQVGRSVAALAGWLAGFV